MGNKVTYIKLTESAGAYVRGLGKNGNREFRAGSQVDGNWGGGTICAMVEDLTRMAVVLSKGNAFVSIPDGSGNRESFDEIVIPFSALSQWNVVKEAAEPVAVEAAKQEKPADPPPAKPVQQGQQQRR